jgi:cation-transporting ATPase I
VGWIPHPRRVLTQPTPSLDRPLIETITIRGAATAAGATLAWQLGRLTPGTARRSSTMGLTALVSTQLTQTLLTRWRSPLVITTAAGSAAVLLVVVQTPGISHFFGCTPLGPAAWGQVAIATTAATTAAVLAPHWLTQHNTRTVETEPTR